MIDRALKRIDWILVLFILPIICAGLVTMKSFAPLENTGEFFNKQVVWILVGLTVFFVFSFLDFRFLKRTEVLAFIFLFNSLILLSLFVLGYVSHGSKSWFDFGFFCLFIWFGYFLIKFFRQPVEPVKKLPNILGAQPRSAYSGPGRIGRNISGGGIHENQH